MEKIIDRELTIDMITFSAIIPNAKSLIAPILNSGYIAQKSKGDINLERVPTYDSGLCHSAIAVNAQTRYFHTENDCIYMIINVRVQ